MELQRLRDDHAAAVLAFEVMNRAYFAASISDRGDEFFANFSEHHRALLVEQDGGACAFHLLLDGDGAVVGRFNLYDIADGAAVVGYRVAEGVAGGGVATTALEQVSRLAQECYDVKTLNALVGDENVASRRVLVTSSAVAGRERPETHGLVESGDRRCVSPPRCRSAPHRCHLPRRGQAPQNPEALNWSSWSGCPDLNRGPLRPEQSQAEFCRSW
jgi:ribosomal-protein-alanine N-acetyltransferase